MSCIEGLVRKHFTELLSTWHASVQCLPPPPIFHIMIPSVVHCASLDMAILSVNPLSPGGKTSLSEAYLPAAQLVQAKAPESEYSPAAHLAQAAVPATEYVPAAQVVPSQTVAKNRNAMQHLMHECREAVFNVILGGVISDRSEILRYDRSNYRTLRHAQAFLAKSLPSVYFGIYFLCGEGNTV